MLLHTNCTCYCTQTVHVTAHRLYMLLFFINHINCLMMSKHILSILHPNMVVCYLYTGVSPCHI